MRRAYAEQWNFLQAEDTQLIREKKNEDGSNGCGGVHGPAARSRGECLATYHANDRVSA
jgi:hypothetical protein